MITVTDEMVEAACAAYRCYWMRSPAHPAFHSEAIRSALEAALRAAPADEPQCCMCGKTGLSTVEGDGGSECQLSDGRWTCSFECWERATERDAPPAPVADGWVMVSKDEMSVAMMDAGQAYLDGKSLNGHFRLPVSFNWHEFWHAMLAAVPTEAGR